MACGSTIKAGKTSNVHLTPDTCQCSAVCQQSVVTRSKRAHRLQCTLGQRHAPSLLVNMHTEGIPTPGMLPGLLSHPRLACLSWRLLDNDYTCCEQVLEKLSKPLPCKSQINLVTFALELIMASGVLL